MKCAFSVFGSNLKQVVTYICYYEKLTYCINDNECIVQFDNNINPARVSILQTDPDAIFVLQVCFRLLVVHKLSFISPLFFFSQLNS